MKDDPRAPSSPILLSTVTQSPGLGLVADSESWRLIGREHGGPRPACGSSSDDGIAARPPSAPRLKHSTCHSSDLARDFFYLQMSKVFHRDYS